jgi:hypothetical protein
MTKKPVLYCTGFFVTGYRAFAMVECVQSDLGRDGLFRDPP